MRQLPAGTVTFLFTDIEGSTRLLDELGDGYVEALAEHRRIVRAAFAGQGGVEVDTQGDAFFVAFAEATAAVSAAAEAQAALESGPIRVRMGLHTGEPLVTEEGYVGHDVHLGARIAAVAHGGQVVVSRATKEAAGAELRDLGEHRVKDFADPVWLFQIGEETFAPLRTIANTNLPRPASSFVGRAREVEELADLLRSPARLVSLTGPGGSGKTRLAIEAASELVPEYPNGVYWVPLTALRDAALVLDEVAHVVGAKDDLATHFVGKRALLLLDNFEQVVEAAPAVAELVERAPGIDVLVTTRELLRVRGEVEHEVVPLAEPDAVALFCERAGTERDHAVVELCRRLDSLPLALELAAARVKIFTPAQLLERLTQRLDLLRGGRDAIPRHQTLRATIEWSYDLLDEEERRLFAWLGVFAGGSTYEAAEAVAGANEETLQSLVEKSLVRRTDGRFWMLETIHEFALERLRDSGRERDLAEQHASYFAVRVAASEPTLRTGAQLETLRWFRMEQGNIRAALDRLEHGDPVAHGRLAGDCWYFWYCLGSVQEGRGRLELALARAAEIPSADRAPLHDGLGQFLFMAGEPGEAPRHASESYRIRVETGDRRGLLRSLLGLATASIATGDWAAAVERLRELAEHARQSDDSWYLSLAVGNIGVAAFHAGDWEQAAALLHEAIGLGERTADPLLRVGWAATLAASEVELGEVAAAADRYREIAERCRDGDNAEQMIWCLNGLGVLHAACGDPGRAAVLLGAAAARATALGYANPYELERNATAVARARERLDASEVDAGLAVGRALSYDEALEYALEAAHAASTARVVG